MRVRVATLNVWALPAPLAEHVPERMKAIGRQLREIDADVFALQEVWTERARDALVASGKRAGLVHSWHNEASIGGGGLLVLTRFPIVNARFQRYWLRGLPEEMGGDFYAGKGFVRLVAETPRGPIVIINTHLHARYAKRVSHEYRALRTGQIVQMALGARDLAVPLVAIGDFNFKERDSGHRVMTGLTGLRDVAAELDRRQPTVTNANAYRSRSKPDRRIDYIFARDGAKRRVRPRWIERVLDEPLEFGGQLADYSDHAGLVAEIEITDDEWAFPGRPKPEAIDLARALLAEGHAEARQRQRGGRVIASAGIAGALMAGASAHGLSTTRRRLLRGALRGAAVAALTPSVGLSILSEVFVPDELRAFDDLADALARVDDNANGSIT